MHNKQIWKQYERNSHLLIFQDSHKKSVLKNDLYSMVLQSLSRNDSIIYSAERNTDKALDRISRLATMNSTKPIQEYLKNESLIVTPNAELPTILQKDAHNRARSLSITSFDQARSYRCKFGTKRCGIIRDPTVLAEKSSVKNLIEFERETGKRFPKPIDVICVYQSDKCIDKFSFSDLVSIVSAHTATIHNGWWYRPWSDELLVELLRAGMAAVLGESSVDLVFKTLKLIYNVDEATIISKPLFFELKLGKLLGFQTARMILEIITGQLKKELAYNRIIGE